jgi:hypothetical protein
VNQASLIDIVSLATDPVHLSWMPLRCSSRHATDHTAVRVDAPEDPEENRPPRHAREEEAPV